MNTQEINKLNEIKEYLANYTLDPTFLNYGGYVYHSKQTDFHPDYRKDYPNGRLNITLRFLEICFPNPEFEISQEFYNAVKKEVAKHKQTDRFKEAVKNQFNSFFLKISYSLTAEAIKEHAPMFDRWYGESKGNNLYPLSRLNADSIRSEFKELDAQAQNMDHVANYKIEIQLKETHFTNEEFKELVQDGYRLFPKKRTTPTTIVNQAIKKSEPKSTYLG